MGKFKKGEKVEVGELNMSSLSDIVFMFLFLSRSEKAACVTLRLNFSLIRSMTSTCLMGEPSSFVVFFITSMMMSFIVISIPPSLL